MTRCVYSNKSDLYHYGILGMKWGVRRTPEQLGHHKIKKGITMYRSTSTPNEAEEGHAYVTYLPPDRDLYRGAFAEGLKRYRGQSSDADLYEHEYKLKEDLNIPSRQELSSVISNIMEDEKARREAGKAFSERLINQWDFFQDNNDTSRWYDKNGNWNQEAFEKDFEKAKKQKIEDFVKEIGSAPASMKFEAGSKALGGSDWLKQQVISELSSRGYNAMVDEGSVGGKSSPREGVEPLIIFDRSASLEKTSSRVVGEKETKAASKRYRDWKFRANSSSNKNQPW